MSIKSAAAVVPGAFMTFLPEGVGAGTLFPRNECRGKSGFFKSQVFVSRVKVSSRPEGLVQTVAWHCCGLLFTCVRTLENH
jgi:hypothetical protein